MVLALDEVKTRRLAPHRHGHIIDMRRTLRASMKAGGALIDLKYLGPKTKQPPIVALLDISGSMSQYTRLFLHFLHAVTDARKRVHSFLFGTRLTNVTRALKSRDPDEALSQCSASVIDWSGGTRIATSLHDFNKRWARRVLTQGAIVLLITDGLERDPDDRLEFEIDRLHRSAGGWSGSIRCCASRASRPRRAASAPSCRMSTNSGRSTISNSIARAVPRAVGIGRPGGRPEGVVEEGGVSRHGRTCPAIHDLHEAQTRMPALAGHDGGEHGLTRTRRRHPESRRGLEGGRARRRARDRGRDLGLGAAAGRLQSGDRRSGQFPRLACRAAASRARS